MVVVPALAACTLPLASTVATVEWLDVKVTPLLLAFSGNTLAVTFAVPPTFSVVLSADNLISPTCCVTVTVIVAVFFPSSVVTVMIAVPGATA